MDPLTIGMLVAAMAGTGLSSVAAAKNTEAKNRARQDALRAGQARQRDFEKRGLELARSAVDEERNLSEMQSQKKGEALAMMAKKNQQAPTSRLGKVYSAQRGQASDAAAKVIGTKGGTSALKRKQASTLLPMSTIIKNAQRDWGVSQAEAMSAGNNASGGKGLMTMATLLKLAGMAAGGIGAAGAGSAAGNSAVLAPKYATPVFT